MHGFEDVTLSWGGKDFVVPASRQLMLIAKIEDALGGDTGEQAVAVLFRKNGPPHSRLAMAYGAAMRYAGASVTDDQVYLTIHEDIANKSAAAVQGTIQTMLAGLLAIISPPTSRALSGRSAADDADGKKLEEPDLSA